MKRIVLLIALGLILAANTASTAADETRASTAVQAPAGEAKRKTMPFRGKVGAIDASAQTITLKGSEKDRTFKLASSARIQRDQKPIQLGDLQLGETVGGLARDAGNGQWEVVVLNLGESIGKKKTSSSKRAKDSTQ